VEVTGEIVLEAQAIFAMDWFFAAGEARGEKSAT